MQTILIVEDEIKYRTLLSDYLMDEGFNVIEAEDGSIAMHYLEESHPDLMIVDIMMPNKDGYQLLKALRKDSALPVIVLTALSEDEDQLKGYELGADDYLTKPYSPKVLVAKVKALLSRWETQQIQSENQLSCGDLTVDLLRRMAFIAESEVSLSPKEYELLVFLIRNVGRALSREQILDSVWGYDYTGGDRTVDIHITRLREKLQGAASKIVTLRKFGYKLERRHE